MRVDREPTANPLPAALPCHADIHDELARAGQVDTGTPSRGLHRDRQRIPNASPGVTGIDAAGGIGHAIGWNFFDWYAFVVRVID